MRLTRLLALAGWLSLQVLVPNAVSGTSTPMAACSSWEPLRSGYPHAGVSRSQVVLPADSRMAVKAAGGPVIRRSLAIRGRIDSLLALPSGQIAALVGPRSSSIRFLPHDDLLLVTFSSGAVQRIPLPPYVVPPGLATSGDGLAVVVDDIVLTVAGTGRPVVRRPLDMAAVGWPAAVTADRAGHLYLVGQEADAWSAQVEALSPLGNVLWRTPLGLTHAGIWLGMAESRELAAYLPDAHDAHGTLTLFDTHAGALRASYDLPAPPLAIDEARGLLYLDTGAGTIQTRMVATGRLLFTTSGAGPLALDSSSGRVAFTRGNEVLVAAPKTLGTEAILRLPGVTALTFTADGTLLAGVDARLDQIVV